jgi:phage terminase Nu1 subunit (DNA packaging protein)
MGLDMQVNKVELARIIGCSKPTLVALLHRHGEAFPVLKRGRRGEDWAFDPDAVLAFLAQVDERGRRAAAERQAALVRQASLPLMRQRGRVLGVVETLRVVREEMTGRDQAVRNAVDGFSDGQGWQAEIGQQLTEVLLDALRTFDVGMQQRLVAAAEVGVPDPT